MPVARLTAWLVLCFCAAGSWATTSFPLPPNRSFLLPVALPPVTRRQMEVAPSPPAVPGEREPTCSELRSMWRHMRRMGRQMEFTNEIPKMQDPFTASAMDRYGGGRRRLSKYPDPNPYSSVGKSSSKDHAVFQHKTDFLHASPKGQFGDVVKDSSRQSSSFSPNRILGDAEDSPGFHAFDDYPGNTANLISSGPRRVPGRFSDSSLPEESLGVYGTMVRTPEERARFRANTRRPPEYGLSRYRTHWGDSTGLGRVPFRATQPHTEYHYGSMVTHQGDRHPLGGFVEFPQDIGQRTPGSGIRVERIDKIALASKLKNSCLRVQNRTCKTDVDCYCNGSPKLFCGGNRCRPLYKAFKNGKQKWGKSWLTDSYESSLMGYAPKKELMWPGPF